MADHPAPLRPLEDAADAIRRLDEYETLEDLASAVVAVSAAAERSLRLRLRADRGTPDPQRLSALSPEALPYDDLIRALRARDLISIEAAGAVHELRAVAERAEAGNVAPGAADVAEAAVDRLRSEFRSDTARVSPDPGPPPPVPEEAAPAVEPRPVPSARPRWLTGVVAAVAALFILLLAWAVLQGGRGDYDAAVTAFRAGRLDSAAAAFERVLADRPDDVSALLYAGRVYRRLDRPEEAAEVLRHAVDVAPEDPDVRRELGHFFMDLGQPRSAARQYERALEQDPDQALNWAGLIRALRADGDPRAEDLLEDAPPEVREALGAGP